MGRAAPGPSAGAAGAELGAVLAGTEGRAQHSPRVSPAPPRAQGTLQPLQNCNKGSTSQQERNCRSFSQGFGFLMPPESVVRFSRLRNNYITNVNNINIPKTKYDLNTFGWYKRKKKPVGVCTVFTRWESPMYLQHERGKYHFLCRTSVPVQPSSAV